MARKAQLGFTQSVSLLLENDDVRVIRSVAVEREMSVSALVRTILRTALRADYCRILQSEKKRDAHV